MATAAVWVDKGEIGTTTIASKSRIRYLGNGIVIAGVGDNIFRSTDYGLNWTDLGSISGDASRDISDIISLGSGVVLCCTQNSYAAIYKSVDWGLTWNLVYYAAGYDGLTCFADMGGGTVFACLWGDHILKSTDYGSSWVDLGEKFGDNACYSMAIPSSGIICALRTEGYYGKIMRSTDSGVNWTEVFSSSNAVGTGCEIFNVGSGVMLAGIGVSAAYIYRSTDSGVTWTKVYTPNPVQSNIGGFANFGSGIIVVGTFQGDGWGRIFRSTDYGATWSDLGAQTGFDEIHSIASFGGTIGVATAEHVIGRGFHSLRTEDITEETTETIPADAKTGFRQRILSSGVYTNYWGWVMPADANKRSYLFDYVNSAIVFSVRSTDDILRVHKGLLSYDEIRMRSATEYYSGFKSATNILSNLVWTLPAADGDPGTFLQTNGSKILSFNNIDHALLGGYHYDTTAHAPALGDIIYGSGGTWTYLAGNTTTSLKVLTQTGTGTVSAVPAWTLGTSAVILTAGYIAYGTGSGITGESHLFWDSTNDRLGIYTNAPGASIDVVYKSGVDVAIQVSGPATVYKNIRLNDSTSGELWDISHRIHTEGNRYELWYYSGAAWSLKFSVDTSGQIGTSSWHGATIDADHGGTGLTSYTIGDLIYASGTTTLAKLADVAAGYVLSSGGVGAAPAYSASPSLTNLNLAGYLQFSDMVAPATPAANAIRVYIEDFKGFSFLNFKDDTGMVRKIVRDSVFVGKNTTVSTIAIGTPVYATGSSGNVPTIAPADAAAVGTMPAIGITIEAIASGAFGRIMQVGLLENFNTNAFTEGNLLFVAAGGGLTATAPLYPNIRQEIGTVLVKGVTNGAIQCIARSMFNEGILSHTGLLNLDFATAGHTGQLPIANGGTGAASLTDGGLLVGAGTSPIEALGVGLTTQILVGGGAGTNPAWGTDIPTAVTIGTAYIYRVGGTDVAVADGGTGAGTAAGAATNLGLGTGDSPTFVTVKCSGLTDGCIPYHVADATGLADSVLRSNGNVLSAGIIPQTYAYFYISGDKTTGVNQAILDIEPTISATGGNYIIYANSTIKAGVSATNYYGFFIENVTLGSGASLSNQYQLYIATPTRGGTVNYAIYSSGGTNYFGSNVLIGITSLVGSELFRCDGDAYFDHDVSALTFTDRTPFYEGDAIKELSKIQSRDGQIDHSTLPSFVQSLKKRDEKYVVERNLGAMVSMLTVAIGQLSDRLIKLEV